MAFAQLTYRESLRDIETCLSAQSAKLLGGAAAWPLVTQAEQRERMRRIGVFMNTTASDAEGQARNAAYLRSCRAMLVSGRIAPSEDSKKAGEVVDPEKLLSAIAQNNGWLASLSRV
jgi:hypothetical protein